MSKLLNNGKQVLSFVLAFMMLATSLFTGVDFKAEAATEGTGTVDTWDNSSGDWYDRVLADNQETGDSWDEAIIIDSAEELAYLATTDGGQAESEGNYYRVADGIKAFNMTPTLLKSGVDMSGDMTPAEVKEILDAACIDKTWWGRIFKGKGFDGNGVTIYGLQGYNTDNSWGSGGLFNKVTAGVTIKNLTIKNSFFQGGSAGALFGSVASGTGSTVTIENIVLTGNAVVCTQGETATANGGVMFGTVGSSNIVSINNCLIYNNIARHVGSYTNGTYTKTGYDITYGLFSTAGSITVDSTTVYSSISNSVILDCFPCSVRYNYLSTGALTYKNIYTDMLGKSVTNKEVNGTTDLNEPTKIDTFTLQQNSNGSFTFVFDVTNISTAEEKNANYPVSAGSFYEITADGAKGAAGKAAMTELPWGTVWFATEGMPTLCYAHHSYEEFTYTNVSTIDECQKETCAVCGAMAATATSHSYVVGEETSTCSKCGFVCDHTDADHYTYSESGSTYTKVCDCGAKVTGTVEIKCADRKTIYWDNTITAPTSTAAGTADDPVIINTASELAYIISDKASYTLQSDGTTPKYFKVADNIGAIVLQKEEYAKDIMALENAAKVQEYFEDTSKEFYRWPELSYEESAFCGYFDGNGATVYGLYQTSGSDDNAGLFSTIEAGASIHNIALKNSYLTRSEGNGYQVGGIFAVTSTTNYALKTSGMVWLDGCVVANCYMRNASTNITRSGVLLGRVGEAVTVDNCLVYGNDAEYGDGVKMAMIGSCINNVSLSARKPEGLEVKKSTNYFYNMFRNVICMDVDVMNTEDTFGYRKNDPDCFVNVLTNGAAGTVTLANGTQTYIESQIKSVTVADLATATLGDAWFNTATYPELCVFHDDVFTCIPDPNDNYAGHITSCSCGAGADATVAHTYTITGEGDTAVSTCGTCGFVCDHQNPDYYENGDIITDGGCIEVSTYERKCDCGAIFTVEVVAVGSHTASGNYYISTNTHADICTLCDKTFDLAQHTDSNSDNLCDICLHTCGDYLFKGASITLTDSIAVNYMVEKTAVDNLISDMYIKFTFCGKDYTVSKYTENGDYYVFTFDRIAPNLMSDVIYATVYGTKDGAAYQSATSEYSIKRYCYNMLEKSTEQDTALRTLLVDLLNYGAEAQAYTNATGDTNYADDTFANADLSDTQKAWGTPRDVLIVSDQNLKYAVVENPTVKWKGAGLYLDEGTTLRFTIETDSIENLVVKATCGTTTLEIPSSKFVKRDDKENCYYVYVRGISVTHMSDTVMLTVYNGDTAVSNTITYSVETYANAKIGGDDAALSDLLIAMIKYGNSAKSYAYKDCEHSLGEGEIMKNAELFVAGIKEYGCTCGYDCKKTYTIDKIKILSISNSYGQDSFMKMHEMCEAAGFTDIDIAVLYYAGCNLETHWQKMQGTHENGYSLYRYTDETKTWEEPDNYAAYITDITKFLTEENDWDIITLQQSSYWSGINNDTSFGNLDNVINYVKTKCPDATLLWNMTWAYQKGSESLESAPYYGDESVMYNGIINCVTNRIIPRVESGTFHSLVPVGTAIMNARTSSLEDTVHRDYSHLSYEFGRYIAALTWFCHITGQSPYDTAFATSNTSLTTEQMNIVLESVYNAIKNPYEITQSIYTE